jgi:hypothetical protein
MPAVPGVRGGCVATVGTEPIDFLAPEPEAPQEGPTTLFEGTGLKIVKNPKNRFSVVTLHYTADPAKRSDAWKAEAQAGMPPARWAKEYEIDYGALFGEKVFPEIVTNRQRIVAPSAAFTFGGHLRFWGALDFGLRNPSAFHAYTIQDGVVFACWELYEPCRNINDFIAKMRACPYWGQMRYIACDPSLKQHRGFRRSDGTPVSVLDSFLENGVRNLLMGNPDEALWLTAMRKHWGPIDPTFRILDCCPNLIREFESMVYAGPSQSEAQFTNRPYRDALVDYNNHALDACKYFMNSQPKAGEVARPWKAKEMWRLWAK